MSISHHHLDPAASQKQTLASMPTIGPVGIRVWRFLRRPSAALTYVYERIPYLGLEALCLAVGILAAPTATLRGAALALAPLAMLHAERLREERSVELRRRAADARAGVLRVQLRCDADVARRQWERDVLAWAWPALSVLVPALAVGATWPPVLAALGTTLARVARDRWALPAWRAWWEARR